VWDDAWVERVEAAELELNRRVCGARTAAGSVCVLESDHACGRCRFHGGFDLTGAPRGNRNAVVHGLYSRRLMVCGEHCPLWKTCPCAGPDVLKMEERERPTCPFEQTEYNALVTDGMSLVERRADANPFDKQAVHMLALLQVMMSRAAAMLGRHKFTQMVVSVNCQKHDERMSPAFAALMRLMWEYRHVRRLLPDGDGGAGATPESVAKLMLRMEVDTDLAPESQEELHFPDTPVESAAAGIVDRAVHSASEGLSERALDAYQVLMKFDPDKDNSRLKRLLLAYRPTHLKIDREFYEKLLRNTFFPSVDDLIEMGEDIDEYREELRQNIEDEKEWERLYGDGASNGENAGLTTKDAKNTNGENQGK
jgi:hypothetical protein